MSFCPLADPAAAGAFAGAGAAPLSPFLHLELVRHGQDLVVGVQRPVITAHIGCGCGFSGAAVVGAGPRGASGTSNLYGTTAQGCPVWGDGVGVRAR
jgi:hypothetical protein